MQPAPVLDLDGLAALQGRQRGVVSRRQVREHGLDDAGVARMLRRREWARVHDGVYVDHTGPLAWDQRAWAAVLAHWPAALSGSSSLRADGVRLGAEEPVHLVVAHDRKTVPVAGVEVHRLTDWARHVRDHASPPRTRLEHAALTAASRAAGDDGVAALLGDVVQARRTTPARLEQTLQTMTRLPRRRLMAEVLADVASGACSALERRDLHDVERAHGLPLGDPQQRVLDDATGAVAYLDVRYAAQAAVVELDGRLGHDRGADLWRDLERDLRGAARGEVVLRARWGTVLQPCRLAGLVGAVLARRGWDGAVSPCSDGCSAAAGPPHDDDTGSPRAPRAGGLPVSGGGAGPVSPCAR